MSRRRKRNKIPQELQSATIHALSHEGRGIASIDERTVFISNALPGEEVNFKYTALNKRLAEGIAIEVLTASPKRTKAECEFFGICGGCSLQHMAHPQQLTLKQETLKELIQHEANLEPDEWLAPLTGPTYAYRHKARLGVRYVAKKESVLVGFRELQNRFLTVMTSCKVLAAPVGELIQPLREVLAQLIMKAEIAQIEVAIGENATALLFRNVETLPPSDRDLLIEFAKQHQLWCFLQPNKPQPLEKIWPQDNNVFLNYSQPDFGLTFEFHPTDFTQINTALNREMVKLTTSLLALEKTDKVLDLFCGLGNFTLPMATLAGHVIGVEGSEAMVERGTMNATANKIDNVEFHAADLTQEITAPWLAQQFDKLLLDPPRSGALEIIPHLKTWQPQRIVYVSCNPATLARDTAEIIKQGYQLKKAGIMDMFPQTGHVESIALFEKNNRVEKK